MTDLPNRPKQSNFKVTLSSPIDSTTTSITLSDVPDYASGGETTQFTILNPKGIEHITATGWDSGTNTLSGVVRGVAKYTGGGSTARAHPAGVTVILGNPFQLYDDINTALASKVDLAGETMTGALAFSGTDHVGLQLLSLTTAERDALGAVPNGAHIYNETLGQVEWREGGAWVTNDAGGTVANASTTVAGKVEEATDAEVGAGTAAGGTGAQLYINPGSVVKTSSGAGDENKLAALDSSGEFAAGFIGKAPVKSTLTAKGSIYAATAASTPGELAVGSAGQVLTVDSAESTGMKWADPDSVSQSFTAYESITADDAVALLPVEVEYYAQLTEADLALGDDNTRRRYAVKFIPTKTTSSLTTMQFRGKEINGSSTTNLTISIQGDNAGEPDGTAITNGTANSIAVSTWGTSYASRTATWASSPTITAGTTYWLVFEVDSTDGAEGIHIGVNSTYDENYLAFTRLTYDLDAGTWGNSVTNATPFFWFNTEVRLLGMAVVPTDANYWGRTFTFIGFAKSSVAAEASVDVYLDVVPNLTVSPGKHYWLSTTAGEITTSSSDAIYSGGTGPSSFGYRIGRALADGSTLKIELGQKRVWIQESSITDTTTRQYILGFKPESVRVDAGIVYNSDLMWSVGAVTVDGADMSLAFTEDSGGSDLVNFSTSNSLQLNDVGAANDFTGAGSNFTDIGFTYTYSDTSSGAGRIFMEAVA